jgi:uncharacterized membrane protein
VRREFLYRDGGGVMAAPENQPQEEKETGRVEAFSDGVLAIAITLLILEVRVPHVEEGGSLAQALLNLWPSYLAYGVSFTIIGIMWLNHHHMFKYIQRVDNAFLLLNTLLLMMITFVNFPTVLLADYLQHSQAQVAGLMYGGTFVVTAIVYNLVWHYAAKGKRLMRKDVDAALIDNITKQYRYGPLLYLLATLLVFVSIYLSLAVHFGLAVFFALTDSRKPVAQ